jgi:hypothetical protein
MIPSKRHEMKEMFAAILVFLLSIVIVGTASLAQSSYVASAEPKQVVQQLLNLEMSGAVLEPGGWGKDSELSERYSLQRQMRGIVAIIISSNYSLDQVQVNKNSANVHLSFNEIGVIGCDLHWAPPDPKLTKTGSTYRLVLSWENAPLRGASRPLPQQRRWRIDAEFPIPVLWLSRTTAIRYVTEMREKSNDPAVKANADKTLAILEKLQE